MKRCVQLHNFLIKKTNNPIKSIYNLRWLFKEVAMQCYQTANMGSHISYQFIDDESRKF
jgi:hypothetical protein